MEVNDSNKEYGWENDLETIWLNYINRKVYELGLIMQEEYMKIERVINLERYEGK